LARARKWITSKFRDDHEIWQISIRAPGDIVRSECRNFSGGRHSARNRFVGRRLQFTSQADIAGTSGQDLLARELISGKPAAQGHLLSLSKSFGIG
jgi:hypothetical protein